MSDNRELKASAVGYLFGALAGALAAGAAALLFAPYSGETTRRLMQARGEVAKSKLEKQMSESLRNAQKSFGELQNAVNALTQDNRELLKRASRPKVAVKE
jgi:gas vesicle protein